MDAATVGATILRIGALFGAIAASIFGCEAIVLVATMMEHKDQTPKKKLFIIIIVFSCDNWLSIKKLLISVMGEGDGSKHSMFDG